MYWSCPSLGKYWRGVLYTLSIALNFNLAPDPLIALSGITGKEDSHLTCHLLFFWPDEQYYYDGKMLYHPPTQWLGDIMSCLSLEKIHYPIHNAHKKFLNVWGPFLKHFQNLSSQWGFTISVLPALACQVNVVHLNN